LFFVSTSAISTMLVSFHVAKTIISRTHK